MPKACNLADVREIKKAVGIPVICAGRFDDPDLADRSIRNGEIDMVGMGRPLLVDPFLPDKCREGKLDDIRPCISCHQGCLGRIFPFKDISCAVNPAAGREVSYALKPADVKKKVLVVGGGMGGMEAARVSAIRGHSVDLYEKTASLGGVFNAATSPDFKEDDRKLLHWYKKQIKDLGVNVHLNSEVKKETLAGARYDEIFVATGATERKLDIPGLDGKNVSCAIGALTAGGTEGASILVIGGGLTGCEIAYNLARKGKRFTIIEITDTILKAFDLSAANYNTALYDQIKGDHVHLVGDARKPTNVMDAIWAAYAEAMRI